MGAADVKLKNILLYMFYYLAKNIFICKIKLSKTFFFKSLISNTVDSAVRLI